MANRRMFSNRIANSAKFLQMPAESQLLYFHMILRADDDGVVESYPLMKLLGVASDNFKVLHAKGFIKQLNEDQVVVITDWLEHNVIRPDRKVDSIYKHLLIEKAPEIPLIEAKPRTDVEDNSKRLGGQSTDGISKVRLGKVKISKDNTLVEASSTGNIVNTTLELFKPLNENYERLYARPPQRQAIERMIKKMGAEKLSRAISFAIQARGQPYAPSITTPVQLEEKMAQLVNFYKSHSKGKYQAGKIIIPKK